MDHKSIITELSRNKDVFESLLRRTKRENFLWKPHPDSWCLLEVVCHLYDEERDDFRARVNHCLENQQLSLPPIDPAGWVKDRKYIEQDFDKSLTNFVEERGRSIKWLSSLKIPKWENSFIHPALGKMSARLFLSNWLAHDYIHIRQITRIKYQYLDETTSDPLDYAGDW